MEFAHSNRGKTLIFKRPQRHARRTGWYALRGCLSCGGTDAESKYFDRNWEIDKEQQLNGKKNFCFL